MNMTTEGEAIVPQQGPIPHAAVIKFPPANDYSGITVYVSPSEWQTDEAGVGSWYELSSIEVAERCAAVYNLLRNDIGAREVNQEPPQQAQQGGPGRGRGLPQQGASARPQQGGRRAAAPAPEPAPGWFCNDCHAPGMRKAKGGKMPGDSIECSACKNDRGFPTNIAWLEPGTDTELPAR